MSTFDITLATWNGPVDVSLTREDVVGLLLKMRNQTVLLIGGEPVEWRYAVEILADAALYFGIGEPVNG